MKITHKNAYPLNTDVPPDDGYTGMGKIIGRRWRVNGELRYYIVKWSDGSFTHMVHEEILAPLKGDDNV